MGDFKGKILNYIPNGDKQFGCVKVEHDTGVQDNDYYCMILGKNVTLKTNQEVTKDYVIPFKYTVEGETEPRDAFYITKSRVDSKKPLRTVTGNDNPPNDGTGVMDIIEHTYENMTLIVDTAPDNLQDLEGETLPIVIEIDNAANNGKGKRREYNFRGKGIRKRKVTFDVVEVSADVYVAYNVKKR
ncbi:MAG: hypothetical protein R2753_13235 [Chitinophagales bacterium]